MQMRLYSELLHTRYSCIFQYMEEAMNCSIGSGQTYFSLSCSIFLFFSLWITYSVVHAILSISVSFEHCVFLEHKLPVGGASWKLHSPKYAWVQKQYGHFAWVSYLQNTVSVEIHRMCNIWTEMKLTVLCHIALGNYRYMHNNIETYWKVFPQLSLWFQGHSLLRWWFCISDGAQD